MQQEVPVRRHAAYRLVRLLFSLLLLVAAIWIFFNRQFIYDWYVLSQYVPPADISQLAEKAHLSELGKRQFYVNKPEVRSKTNFSIGCNQAGDEQSNVLGCYTGEKIYIFNVTDQRLAGVKEVTTAHEMLHSAYVRLSGGEKQYIDTLIQKQLDTYTASHVKELIEVYNRLEPGQLTNEMHSILATEQSTILPELETYYQRYFTSRAAVVQLANKYRRVFDDLKQAQNQLLNELNALADTINRTTSQLNADIQALNAAVETFNQAAANGSMSQTEFSVQRSQLVAQKNAISARIDENNTLRTKYEQKRQAYDTAALTSAELQKSIDSRPSAPEAVQ